LKNQEGRGGHRGRKWHLTIEGASRTEFQEVKDGLHVTGIRVYDDIHYGQETLTIPDARQRWESLIAKGAIPVEKTPVEKPDDTKKEEREWINKLITKHLQHQEEQPADVHALYVENKQKHDKDFYKYDSYALEA